MTTFSIVSGHLVAVKHGVVTAEIRHLGDYFRVAASDYSVKLDPAVMTPEEFTTRQDVIVLARQISQVHQ